MSEENADSQTSPSVRSRGERFRLLFEHSPDAILLLDPHAPNNTWPIIDCNDIACDMNGYTRSELIGQSIDILRENETTEEMDQDYLAQLRADSHLRFDTIHRHKNGQTILVEASTSVVMLDGRELVLEIDRDITQRKLVERKLIDAQAFLEATLNSLSAHVAIIDSDGVIISVNTAWRRFAEQPDAMRIYRAGANYLESCDHAAAEGDEAAAKAAAGIRDVIENRQSTFSLEYPRHTPEYQRWFVMNVSRFEHSGPIRVVIAHEDVTPAHLAAEQMRHVALHDALTGLPNRALFHDHLHHALVQIRRHSDNRFAVLFLDLDRFKVVNDTLGHLAGDMLLRGVARRLEGCLRPSDVAARMGGDEFTILLNNVNGVRDTTMVAERLLRSLRAPFTIYGHEITPTVSIGIVLYRSIYEHPDDLLRDADAALQRAKALGKDRFEVFDSVMHREITARLRLETDLRQMVTRHETRVLYQPIYDIADGSIVAVEGLVRWQHHEFGLLVPSEFLPVADETGMLIPIGEYVLRQACQDARLWQHTGSRPVPLAINLSTRQLRHNSFRSMMAQAIDASGLAPGLLELELSEDGILTADDTLTTLHQDLVRYGIRLIIDTFGSGSGNLGTLAQAPISGIKLARHLVASITNGPGQRMIPALIALAHGLDLKVTAVGVETDEQLAQLRMLGCDYAQGFRLSQPLSNDALVTLLQGVRQSDNIPSLPNWHS